MKALLIGCATFGLEGPNNDVKQMAAALKLRGFENPVRLVGKRATRKGILDAYLQFIQTVETDEPALIYYSGHGAMVANPLYEPHTKLPSQCQFILPTDYRTENAPFCGILEVELSHLLAELTDRTKNVVVIMDCCFSGGISRDYRFRIRSPKNLQHPGLKRSFEGFRHFWNRRYPGGNEDAVRLSACGKHKQAVEYYSNRGQMGIFTEALVTFLEQSPEVSWQALMQWVRERVLAVKSDQRPDMEGPIHHQIFARHMGPAPDVFPVFKDGDSWRLRAGCIHGITEGNLYALLPKTSYQFSEEAVLSKVKVEETCPGTSCLTVVAGEPITGARAFPLSTYFPKQPVKQATAPDPLFLEALARSPKLKTWKEEDNLPPLATLEQNWVIRDEDGDTTVLADLDQTLVFLNRCAHARALRALSSNHPLSCDYHFSWGRVVEGRAIASTRHILHVDDRIFVRIANQGSDILYLHLFYISLDKEIIRLTHARHHGLEVGPQQVEYVGYQPANGYGNLRMIWSPYLPQKGCRAVHLTAIISNEPHDLSNLADRAQRLNSSLERLTAFLLDGQSREHQTAPPSGYDVNHIPLLLYASR